MNPVIIIIIAVVCSVVSTAGVIMINSMVEEQNKHDEEQRNLEEAKFQQNYLEQKKEFEKQKAIAEKQQLQEEANEIARQMDASIAQSLKDKRESIEKSNMFAAPWSGSDKTVEDFLKDFRDVESTADRQKKFDAIMDEIQTNLDSINKQISILNNKLKNKAYITNAPKEIVQNDKKLVKELTVEDVKLRSIVSSIN